MSMIFIAKCPDCWARIDDCTCGLMPVTKPITRKIGQPKKIRVDKNNRKVK